LKVSCFVPFKIVRMSKGLSYSVLGIGSLLLLFLLGYLIMNWNNPTPWQQIDITYNFIGLTLIVFLVGFLSKFLAKVINIESVVKKKAVLFVLITFGWVFSRIYIGIFNPWYNRMGRIK
jgi:hypothetical protein